MYLRSREPCRTRGQSASDAHGDGTAAGVGSLSLTPTNNDEPEQIRNKKTAHSRPRSRHPLAAPSRVNGAKGVSPDRQEHEAGKSTAARARTASNARKQGTGHSPSGEFHTFFPDGVQPSCPTATATAKVTICQEQQYLQFTLNLFPGTQNQKSSKDRPSRS